MDLRKSGEVLVAAAIGAIIPIVGAVYLLGGRMSDLDRLANEVDELRTEIRSTQTSLEGTRAEMRQSVADALQEFSAKLSTMPTISGSPAGLTDQMQTATDLEEIRKVHEKQIEWTEDLSNHVGKMLDDFMKSTTIQLDSSKEPADENSSGQ